MNYKILTLVVALVVTFTFIGCSKDEDGDPKKGVVKFTVTSSEAFTTADNSHSLDVSIGAFDAKGDFLDVKINGEVSSGVKVIHRKHDADFNGGKTYTFETVGDYDRVQINIAEESLTITEDGNTYLQPYMLK